MRPGCALALVMAAGCEAGQAFTTPSPGFERMLRQPRAEAYGTSPLDDGPVMRAPPSGTVAWDDPTGSPMALRGAEGGRYADRVPVPVTSARMAVGRERFETLCATCHGILGDGDSVVGRDMAVRRPPSLHDARYRAYPVGRLYQTVTEGYGLMSGYAWQLSVEERWAVVAYVRALQLSQHALVAALPLEIQAALRREAP